ncbi:MAG: DUF4156 domain-containing protein [Candidatus Polarisedimenticolaceae bacterium]|nr:DUF4156 domain-containing protein [Candidatus Polarisedimenticolaceae bacterium]
MNKQIVLLALTVALSGCSWVKVTKEGETVRLMPSADDVSSCKQLGTTTTKVLSKVLLKRNEETVAAELATLARNQAAKMGGDTVAPISEIVEGERTFGIYQCVQP